MKIRAIVNGVSFYTNRTAIRQQRSGDHSLQNTALYFALDKMGKGTGVATTVTLYDTGMRRHQYDIQLTAI